MYFLNELTQYSFGSLLSLSDLSTCNGNYESNSDRQTFQGNQAVTNWPRKEISIARVRCLCPCSWPLPWLLRGHGGPSYFIPRSLHFSCHYIPKGKIVCTTSQGSYFIPHGYYILYGYYILTSYYIPKLLHPV